MARSNESNRVFVIKDSATADYGFGNGHPFSPDRHAAFHNALAASDVARLVEYRAGRMALREELESFHSPQYLDFVAAQCRVGLGMLDGGDTPAEAGLYEASAAVVGATLSMVEALMDGSARRAFVPIGGLHHARRDGAAGFCVFNDCAIATEILRSKYGLQRIAYVDIDAHHGDGMFYAYEADPDIFIADIHEDGRALFPGTGHARETGKGAAEGTKLNIPLRPRSGDDRFMAAWPKVESFLEQARPEFILFQCGADSIRGDPLTHLEYTPAAHAHAARRLCELADRFCAGRVLGMGGGGYNLDNVAEGWLAVVRAFVQASSAP